LFDEGVELVRPLFIVPVLADSRCEGGVSLVVEGQVNPLSKGLIGAEEVPLGAGEWPAGEEDRSGSEQAGVNGVTFA
jgi:hypothetical protein